jgi:hypothetical protein
MEEKTIYEGYKTSSEDERKDRGGTDSGLIEETSVATWTLSIAINQRGRN